LRIGFPLALLVETWHLVEKYPSMTISIPNSATQESVSEITSGFDIPKNAQSMGLDLAAKNRNDSEAILDSLGNDLQEGGTKAVEEENYIDLESSLSKAQMKNSRNFVLSRKFPYRTAQTDQAVLVALINESIMYVNGLSGVRPGNRKLRTATNLNIETISISLQRLHSQGWVTLYSKGSRSGTASVWRVNFEKFYIFGYQHSFDYTGFNHPLAEHFRLWTKFGLGIKALHILNFLCQHHGKSGEFLSVKKSSIEKGTGYSWKSVTDGLSDLMNLNLVMRIGSKYSINELSVKEPESFVELICDYYSIYTRVEKREHQQKLEQLASAQYRGIEREKNIQQKIKANNSRNRMR